MNKWRNYGLWASLGSLTLLILQKSGYIPSVGEYQPFLDLFLATLSAAGIISSPTIGKGYTDKNK